MKIECTWCPDTGYRCLYLATSKSTCCGCEGKGCTVCPSSSSCATWWKNDQPCPERNPHNKDGYPDNRSNKFGTCKWDHYVNLQMGHSTVLRCHSIPEGGNVTVTWDVDAGWSLEGIVMIFDKANYANYNTPGKRYTCLNDCDIRRSSLRGQLVAPSSSEDIYFEVTGLIIGYRPQYHIQASVLPQNPNL